MEALLRRYLSTFTTNPTLAGQNLRQRFETDPASFQKAAVSLLKDCSDSPGYRYLLTMLIQSGTVLKWLCDPTIFTRIEASAIIRQLSRVDPQVDWKLIEMAIDSPGDVHGAATLRMLDILSDASDALRIMGKLAQLSRHEDPRVRSKAILLMGRRNKNHKWVFNFLSESDARTRANAVESLWDVDTGGARAVLWEALGDADNRVVGNAVIGLYRLGDSSAIGFLQRLVRHDDAEFQATGLWAIQQTADVRFIPVLEQITPANGEMAVRAAQVLSCLKEKLARLSKRPPLQLLCHDSKIDSETGLTNLQVSIFEHNRLVDGLNAGHIAIFHGSSVVEDYRVRRDAGSEPVALAFVIPYSIERAYSERLIEAARDALQLRRTGDEWCAIRYRSKKAVYSLDDAPARQLTHTLQLGLTMTQTERLDDDLSAPAVRFGGRDGEIEDMLFDAGAREVCAGSLLAAVLAVSAAHSKNLKCHIVALLDERSETRPADPTSEVTRLIRNTRSVLHVISPRPSEFGRSLAEASGGDYHPSSNYDQISGVVRLTCAKLAGVYRIDFRVDPSLPLSPPLLQIATQNAIGRLEFPIPAH